MEVFSLGNGDFLLQAEAGKLIFSFVSDTCFRFRREDAPKSHCVQAFSPVNEGVEWEKGEREAIFFYEGNEVHVLEDLSFHAAFLGQKYLRGSLHLEGFDGHKGGFRLEADKPIYGLGEKTGPLDKRGYSYINWNTDDPSAHVDTFPSLYQSNPFFTIFDADQSVGVFLDNTSKTFFDFNKKDPKAIEVAYSEADLDLYFFYGSLPQVIADFSSLTGRGQLPPYWALGAQQSRWSYPNKEEVEEVIAGYEKADLPLSVVYLDIDYMDSYKDFTVDERKFPDVRSWLSGLSEKGIHVVPIIDAGVKAEPGYEIYDEMLEKGLLCTRDGEVYHNEVWPGDSVFPAFLDPKVRAYWAVKIKRFLDLGFSGIWNDMNEPASFKGPLPDDVMMGMNTPHSLAHNVYGHHMVEAGAQGFALANRRPFQLTRAGYAGTALYSGSWAGDNQSIYDHLRLCLPELMNMGLSGQPYVGVDIGGFGGDSTPELLAKWSVAALFAPLYRNHSAINTKRQEPYLLEGEPFACYKKAMHVRYELLPTLYDELFLAESRGSVPMRPLIYNYPDDPRVQNENTEVMLGADLLLIPSLMPGQSKRAGYFPEDFLDFFSGKPYPKGDHLVDCGYGDIPLFLRKNGLVVLSPKGNREARRSSTLRLLYGGGVAKTFHYEDAGDGLGYKKGEYNLLLLEANPEEGVKMTYLHKGLPSGYDRLVVDIPGGKHFETPLEKE